MISLANLHSSPTFKREQKEQEAHVLAAMKEKYDNALENLVSSSQVSEDEATAYREKLMKDVETLDRKIEKQRNRQEESLHDRLSLLKKKKLQEKVRLIRRKDFRKTFTVVNKLIGSRKRLGFPWNVEVRKRRNEEDEWQNHFAILNSTTSLIRNFIDIRKNNTSWPWRI